MYDCCLSVRDKIQKFIEKYDLPSKNPERPNIEKLTPD